MSDGDRDGVRASGQRGGGSPASLVQLAAALGLVAAFRGRGASEMVDERSSDIIDPEKQYEFFQRLYDEEVAREKQINEHAKSNLTLVTLYSAFVLFVAEKLKPVDLPLKILFGVAAASMVGAFVQSLRSSAIAEFEAINDPRAVAINYPQRPRASDFYDDRIADLVVASERNSAVNDRKAKRLTWAGYLLLAGIVCHGIYFMMQVMIPSTPAQLNTGAPNSGQACSSEKGT